MRTATTEYCCNIRPLEGRLVLGLDYWHMGDFPMTYTVEECLEEFCESIGWRYLSHTGGLLTFETSSSFSVTADLARYAQRGGGMNNPVMVQGIQKTVTAYLNGEITLGDLQDWLAPHAWGVDESTDPLISDPIYFIELRIAEYTAGHLPLNDFVAELKKLL